MQSSLCLAAALMTGCGAEAGDIHPTTFADVERDTMTQKHHRQTSGTVREQGSVRSLSLRPLALSVLVFLSGCTSIQTNIQIDAPAKTVREVLLDFRDYPVWNPFIVKVEGTVAPGNEIHVTVKPVGKDPLSGDTLVTSLTATRLAWSGGLRFPGLFEGNHEFIVEDLGANKTLFHQNERMSGIAILFANFKPEADGFILMNQELKTRAEKTAQSGSP